MPIQPGQTYRSCDPRGGFSIRVTNTDDDVNAVQVVDALTGKRPRRILRRSLHDSPFTRDGKPRRTGYALETK